MELQILDAIQTLRTPVGDAIMPMITSLGNGGIFWILLTAVLLLIKRTRKAGLLMMAALLLDLILCNGIVKPLAARTRPFDVNTAVEILIKKPKDYSFPSGHTAASFAAVSALMFAGYKKGALAAGVLACLIAFSRLYLYVHYPTDVLGGVVLGVFCGWLGTRLVRRVTGYIQQRDLPSKFNKWLLTNKK